MDEGLPGVAVTSVEQFKGRKARFVFCKVTLRQLVVLLDEAAEESLLEEMGTAPSVAELSQRFSQVTTCQNLFGWLYLRVASGNGVQFK